MQPTLRRLIDRCWTIAQLSSDKEGFVALRSLAESSNCAIATHPLLAEAVITRANQGIGQWTVLLNSEIHNHKDEDWELESHLSPLPPRTRNTVAHEIAHAIAADLLGLDPTKTGTLSDRLSEVESMIETVSPLLLLPKNIFTKDLDVVTTAQALRHIVSLNKKHGVSREVFISALRLYNRLNRATFLQHDGLLNTSFGVIKTSSRSTFSVSPRNIFQNLYKSSGCFAQQVLAERKKTSWDIESIEEYDGRVFCKAKLNSCNPLSTSSIFEIETKPSKARQSLFFRLGSNPA